MQINLQDSNKAMAGFINVVGVSKDTPVAEANKLIEAFVGDLNSGALNINAFKAKDGKWVIGFK